MRYEVWTDGIRLGNLLIATNDINQAIEIKGNNYDSTLVDTENVNVYGAVIRATQSLKSNEKVVVCELKDGNRTVVEDMAGNLHTVDFNNIRLE